MERMIERTPRNDGKGTRVGGGQVVSMTSYPQKSQLSVPDPEGLMPVTGRQRKASFGSCSE